jgi:hypothetical protein
MRTFERLLLRLDQLPWAALLRLAVGYLVVPAWSGLTGARSSGWSLIPFFLGILIAFRLVPAGLRRLLPFGGSVQATWAERRQLAKRFDSYQWQKLFWIGLGLITYILLSSRQFAALWTLTFVCLVSGSLGLLIWRNRRAQLEKHRSTSA